MALVAYTGQLCNPCMLRVDHKRAILGTHRVFLFQHIENKPCHRPTTFQMKFAALHVYRSNKNSRAGSTVHWSCPAVWTFLKERNPDGNSVIRQQTYHEPMM
jgi:hypothetical protein